MRVVAYWLAVGLVAVVSVILFKLIAAKVPIPALQSLAAAA